MYRLDQPSTSATRSSHLRKQRACYCNSSHDRSNKLILLTALTLRVGSTSADDPKKTSRLSDRHQHRENFRVLNHHARLSADCAVATYLNAQTIVRFDSTRYDTSVGMYRRFEILIRFPAALSATTEPQTVGRPLSAIAGLAKQSRHPLSRPPEDTALRIMKIPEFIVVIQLTVVHDVDNVRQMGENVERCERSLYSHAICAWYSQMKICWVSQTLNVHGCGSVNRIRIILRTRLRKGRNPSAAMTFLPLQPQRTPQQTTWL
ncbi:unnamed protein product [Nesidiocoris tenuis]|uniref:Uncharacterized protein n=1 Tax=Nesidiocoris tenuis TaxID=355587 RepID=A0A6H5HGW8_9HEMI|nr:unnamed protein product [Nesidiocoris tenuis]